MYRMVQAYFAKRWILVELHDLSTLRKIRIYFLFDFSFFFSRPFSTPYNYTVQYRTPKWRNIELRPVLPVLFYVSKTRCAVYENIDGIYILHRIHRYSHKQRKLTTMCKLDHLKSPLFLFFIAREYVAMRASVESIVRNNRLKKIYDIL